MGKKQKDLLRSDFLVVVGMVLAAIPISIYFEVRFLTSTILFFGLPAAFLFVRKPKQIPRLVAAVTMCLLAAFSMDLIAELNGAWSWAPEGQLVFPNKVFGIVPVDVIIWYFLWLCLLFIQYEHFFEHESSTKVSSAFKKGFALMGGMAVVTIFTFIVYKDLLYFRYAYFVLGILATVPFFYLVAIKPRLIGKLLKASIFNVFLFLAFELTALHLDQWRFPGQYIAEVNMLGYVFPFEEFIFWILLGSPVVLSYYELFVDDRK